MKGQGLLGFSGPHPWLFGARPSQGGVRRASGVLGSSPWLFVILWHAGRQQMQARRQPAAASANSAATLKAERLGYLWAPPPLAEQVAVPARRHRLSTQAMAGHEGVDAWLNTL